MTKSEFPSPCGDELILHRNGEETYQRLFPSPCGDELILDELADMGVDAGFRPLAGMS